MGYCEITIERRDGSKEHVDYGSPDPLRDDAPKSQFEQELEKFEDWTRDRKEPVV